MHEHPVEWPGLIVSFFSQDMQLEIKVVFLVKWPSLRSAPHLSFQQKSPSFLPLCSVTLWISRPFPGQAAVVLAKTEPEQQCSLFPVGDMEQMLHCRVLIQAMGKRAFDFFFCIWPMWSADFPQMSSAANLRCWSDAFPCTVAHLCLPVSIGALPAVAAGFSLPLSPSILKTHLDLVLSGKAKRA